MDTPKQRTPGPKLAVNRKQLRFLSDHTRVITRLFRPGDRAQIQMIFHHVIGLPEEEAALMLRETLSDFGERHRDIRAILLDHYNDAADFVSDVGETSWAKKLLIGSFFTMEYSIESAALFNPSVVFAADQTDLPAGHSRVILSFRATGEGHVSSLQFRSGVLTEQNDLIVDAACPHLETPKLARNMFYQRELFGMQLIEMHMPQEAHAPDLPPFLARNDIISDLLDEVNETFTLEELQKAMLTVRNSAGHTSADIDAVLDRVSWFAASNYEVRFSPESDLSERILFPVSANERRGIEDARFLRFIDQDEVAYFATYTAFDGERSRTQLLETTDFVSFRISTLNGAYADAKGLALFPRKVGGKYAMLSRLAGREFAVMYSDNVRFWHEAHVMPYELDPWEFLQIGNCGSPIETDEGWLVVTHGVGAMRRYCLGAMLLDLDDPLRVIGKLHKPLLAPEEAEREGYVPNVVYTCGSVVHNGELIIPYAMADRASSIATVPLGALLDALRDGGTDGPTANTFHRPSG